MNHRPHRRRPPLHWLLACALAACAPAGDAPPPSDASAAPMPELPPGGLAIVDPQHPAHPTWVELGDIPLGEVVRYEVPLRNRERGPLVIQSIRSGCSCTIPSVYYEADDGHVLQGDLQSAGNVLTVPAGAVVKLQLEVDSKRSPTRNKPKLVVVRIVTDSPTAPFTSLDVRMRIDAPLLAEPAAIDLGRVAVHARAEGSTRILPQGDPPLRVVGATASEERLSATVAESEELGRLSWNLRVAIDPPIALGYRELSVELQTARTDERGREVPGRPLTVPVRVNGVPDFEVRPTRLLIQAPAPGADEVAEASLVAHVPGDRFLVRDVRLQGDHAAELELEVEPQTPDVDGKSGLWVLRLRAPEDFGPETYGGTVTVVTDDPQIGTLEVPYIRPAPG